jgi:hypothetical protein
VAPVEEPAGPALVRGLTDCAKAFLPNEQVLDILVISDHGKVPMADEIQPNDTKQERGARMQRLRIGLTGLAIVLLVVALSTVIYTRFNRQADLADGNVTGNVSANVSDPANEPLAELGVVPGTAVDPANKSNSSFPATPSARP